MSGSLWEWTIDEWHRSYDEDEGSPSRGETVWGYLSPCKVRCVREYGRRVRRGGSMCERLFGSTTTARSSASPDMANIDLGFRPMKPVQ